MRRDADHSEVMERAYAAVWGASEWTRIVCPRCEEEGYSRRDMAVALASGYFECHRCHYLGYFEPSEEHAVKAAEATIFEVAGRKSKHKTKFSDDDRVSLPPQSYDLADDVFRQSVTGRTVTAWLRSRNVSVKKAVRAGLHYCTAERSPFNGRVLFPVWSEDGDLDGFVGRALDGRREPKYLNSKAFPRDRIVYGLDAIDRGAEMIALAEGPLDVAPSWGFAAGFLGKPVESQIEILLAWAGRRRLKIGVALDPDAWREGLYLTGLLRRRGHDIRFIEFPAGKDAGDVGARLKKIVRRAFSR